MIDQILTLISMLVAVGFVIFLAYFTTIIIAKKSNGLLKNPSVKILEKSNVGLQVSITIIQINTKVYILANHGKQLVVLDTIDAEEWHQSRLSQLANKETQQEQLPMPMEYLLKKFKRVGINSILKKGDEDHTDE